MSLEQKSLRPWHGQEMLDRESKEFKLSFRDSMVEQLLLVLMSTWSR